MFMSNRTQRSKSKIIILALILLLPGFLYIAVNRFGSNEYVSLPVFGEKKLSGELKRNWGREYPDTIFHTLTPIAFKDIDGKGVTFPVSDTSITVTHLFYTKDESFSRLMLDNVNALSSRFAANPQIRFFSISVDPTEDVGRLRQMLKPYSQWEQRHWEIGMHPSVDIFSYAKDELLVDAMIDPADSSRFLISNQMILVDSKRRIRGFYDISQKGEVDRLEDEIKLLMVEEIRNRPLKLEKR